MQHTVSSPDFLLSYPQPLNITTLNCSLGFPLLHILFPTFALPPCSLSWLDISCKFKLCLLYVISFQGMHLREMKYMSKKGLYNNLPSSLNNKRQKLKITQMFINNRVMGQFVPKDDCSINHTSYYSFPYVLFFLEFFVAFD